MRRQRNLNNSDQTRHAQNFCAVAKGGTVYKALEMLLKKDRRKLPVVLSRFEWYASYFLYAYSFLYTIVLQGVMDFQNLLAIWRQYSQLQDGNVSILYNRMEFTQCRLCRYSVRRWRFSQEWAEHQTIAGNFRITDI